MLTTQLEYDLPEDRIAITPADPRDAARLMVIDRRDGGVRHLRVRDLPGLVNTSPQTRERNTPDMTGLDPGDLLVFNQTRVVPASFSGVRIATGGKVSGLYLGSSNGDGAYQWRVMLESRGSLRIGERVRVGDHVELQLVEKLEGGGWITRQIDGPDPLTVLEQVGTPPLPPYIRRRRRGLNQPEIQPRDTDRYNTVYAVDPGSVAAPTAGLHFTEKLLDELDHKGIRRAYVTLHVGLGTFAPVRCESLEDHQIHHESVRIPQSTLRAIRLARELGRKIIPIGTTTVRALETLPKSLPLRDDFVTDTHLFIKPPPAPEQPPEQPPRLPPVASPNPSSDQYSEDVNRDMNRHLDGDNHTGSFPFRFTDGLMTNFHLPRSTLLAMVAALPGVGLDRLKAWYREAIEHEYRFYSYGDAMLIL